MEDDNEGANVPAYSMTTTLGGETTLGDDMMEGFLLDEETINNVI